MSQAALPHIVRHVAIALAGWMLLTGAFSAQAVPGTPMRILLLVDSSLYIEPQITQFRAALNEFLDTLPGDPEIGLVSSGGRLRVRVQPTTDRRKLREAVGIFTPDGGANAFVDALLEADRRFLRVAPDKRSVFVILTTDSGQWQGEPRVEEYNRFVRDFHRRGGRAHGIVIHGPNTGMTTVILKNLTDNTGGYFESLLLANGLPGKVRSLVDMLAADQ